MAKKEFLKAKWLDLVMLNYEVDPGILSSYIPPATELDLWQGKCLVSMVGFMFKDTYMKGVKWPLHVNFEEVNLRFYVKHFDGTQWRRGAVFVSEIVPKPFIALTANMLYKEHYSAMPMRHSVRSLGVQRTEYLYEWKFDGKWGNKIGGIVNQNDLRPIQPGTHEEFILEHYWGYNKINNKTTWEYQVEHVTWNAANIIDPIFEADVKRLYGKEFVPFLEAKPFSAFYADGSDVIVRDVEKIYADQVPVK